MNKLLVLFIILNSFFCFANEEIKAIQQVKTKMSASSRENRLNKRFIFGIEPFGINSNTTAYSFKGGMYLKSNLVLFAQYSDLKADGSHSSFFNEPEFVEDTWAENKRGHLIQVGVQYFRGNSFYVKAALIKRSQYYINSVEHYRDVMVHVDSSQVEDYAINFSIGNQWQFKNFLIGCDWIGTSKVIAGNYDNVPKDLKKEITYFGNSLNLTMGASF